MTRRLLFAAATMFAAACAKSTPEATPAPTTANLSDGCPTIVSEFLANPSTPPDRVAEPIKMDPQPIPRPYPKDLLKNGKAKVEAEIMVDTLGRPDAKSFKLVTSTHPYLTKSVRTALTKWKYKPAELRGCKIPRVYKFEAHFPPTGNS